MEFVKIIEEIEPWKNSDRTYKVFINDPEEFTAFMAEYKPQNPRHMIDTISKFQPLLTWTSCKIFAKVLMAFQYDLKYFVIYEYFECHNRSISLEESQNSLSEAENGLKFIHDKRSYHGDICLENIKVTSDGLKIIGWTIPKMRSFDPEPELDYFQKDINNLRQSFTELTGFSLEHLIANRTFSTKKSQKPEHQVISIDSLKDNSVFFVAGKTIKFFDDEKETSISDFRIPKGSVLSFYKRKLFISGGDFSDLEFFEYNFTQNSVNRSAGLLSPHKYHTGIEFNGLLWVLGGIRSKKCEFFDGEIWTKGPDLPGFSENPTCSISETLYLYSKGIFKLVQNAWVKLYEFDWIACQGINISKTQILIFGGRTPLSYNSDILLFDETTSSLTKHSEDSTGLYGLYSYITPNSTLLIANNAGKVKKINLSLYLSQ